MLTTDRSFCRLFNTQSPTSRLIAWALRLQVHTLVIVHKPGKMHADGDCLSRYQLDIPTEQLNSRDAPEELFHEKDIGNKKIYMSSPTEPFVSQLVKELLISGCKASFHFRIFPAVQRLVRKIQSNTSTYAARYVDEQRRREQNLPFVVFATNISVHHTRGKSPLSFGREPTFLLNIALTTIQEPRRRGRQLVFLKRHAAANARVKAKQNYVYANDDHLDVQDKLGDFLLVQDSGKKGRATKLLLGHEPMLRTIPCHSQSFQHKSRGGNPG